MGLTLLCFSLRHLKFRSGTILDATDQAKVHRECRPPLLASDKSEKGEILKSLEECTHRDRKHLIKVLNGSKNGWSNVAQSKIGRPLSYNKEELLPHVRRLWLNRERISPWRMKAGLKDWLPFDDECLGYLKL